MINFSIRNLKLYFRDKVGLFFSLFGVIITLLIYILFLGNVWISNFKLIPHINLLMYSWLFSGIIAMTTLTTSLGAYGTMVSDRELKKSKDFMVSPMKSHIIVAGYIISAVTISLIMSFFLTIVSLAYIMINGAAALNLMQVLSLIGIIFISSLSNSAFVLCIVAPLNTMSSFGTASSVIGTVIGFFAGVYLPLGQLPEAIRSIASFFPVTHSASLLRKVLTQNTMAVSFANMPAGFISNFKTLMGIDINFAGQKISSGISLIYMLICTLIFFGISLLILGRKQK